MKFCSNCGAPLIEHSKFCNECGSKVVDSVIPNSSPAVVSTPVDTGSVLKQAKCWSVFAKVGFGLGLAGLICSFIYVYGIIISLHGLVFSILGLRSYTRHGKAVAGLVMSIIGASLGFIFTIACIACIIEFGEVEVNNGYYEQYANLIRAFIR